MSITSFQELKDSIKTRLEHTGEWKRMSAIIHKKVCYFLQEEGLPKNIPSADPKVAKINKFVVKYLKSQGYENTLSVFLLETGIDAADLDKLDFEATVQEIIQP